MGTSKELQRIGLVQQVVRVMHYIPGGALFFAVIPLLILGYFGWYYWGAEHLDQALYSIRMENLEVTPQPSWIRKSNVREEVFQTNGLGKLSLLDPQASATIARAFESNVWVHHTTRVTKVAGGKVTVDIEYRRPVGMVFYQGVIQGEQKKGFYPIDENGVILPLDDFDQNQIWDYYIQIYAEGVPGGYEGMTFSDQRIQQALALCRILEPQQSDLRIQQIIVTRDNSAGPSPWVMMLKTRDYCNILWGHAPGKEAAGEASAKEKLAQLVEFRSSTAGLKEIDLTKAKVSEARLTNSRLP